MITQTQAKYLIELPKHLIDDGIFLEQFIYEPSLPIDDRLYLKSKNDDEFTFFLEIFQSKKNYLRLSLHCQEDESSIGLIRIDFNGRHRNPAFINEYVPEQFRDLAGQWIEGSHIHYFVEGYKALAWAIPLYVDNTFPLKEFVDESEIGKIVMAFGDKVNLKTKLNINLQTRII